VLVKNVIGMLQLMDLTYFMLTKLLAGHSVYAHTSQTIANPR
jgi:hypothetical protein